MLLGGDPGIGKSTLLLQASAALGAAHRTLYVTGEESADQIALRAQRLGLVNAPVELLAEVRLEAIVAAIDATRPEIVVIDSIQTVYTEALASAPGSVAQVRECAAQMTRLAKQRGVIVLFVGHVTKEGAIAGPRVLEHIVDTVLYFEGDPHSSFRLIARDQEPLRRGERARRVRDDGTGIARRYQSVGDVSVAARGPRARARRSWRRSRIAAAVGRDPGARSIRCKARCRAASRWASTRSVSRCCWPCSIVTAGSTPPASTFSSTRSAGSASRSPPWTWLCCLPVQSSLETSHYKVNLLCLAR